MLSIGGRVIDGVASAAKGALIVPDAVLSKLQESIIPSKQQKFIVSDGLKPVIEGLPGNVDKTVNGQRDPLNSIQDLGQIPKDSTTVLNGLSNQPPTDDKGVLEAATAGLP